MHTDHHFNKFEISLEKDKALLALQNIENQFNTLPDLELSHFSSDDTAIIYVDIINGFVSEGNLSSSRALEIIEPVKALDLKMKGYHKVFFIDAHPEDAVEFKTYPSHCVKGTSEVNLATEFDVHSPKSVTFEKNCVNGFLAPGFDTWLSRMSQIKHFIVVGLVTDICVMNFALTLRAYLNQWNIDSEVIVPLSCVETFNLDITNHHAPLMNLFALYNMQMNGIQLYK